VILKKYKSQSEAVEMTVNSKEENSTNLCLDFAHARIRPLFLTKNHIQPLSWPSLPPLFHKYTVFDYLFTIALYCVSCLVLQYKDMQGDSGSRKVGLYSICSTGCLNSVCSRLPHPWLQHAKTAVRHLCSHIYICRMHTLLTRIYRGFHISITNRNV
jgi:hypothetical protein